MKLCVVRRESGPARVPRSTLWTGLSAGTWYSGFPLDMKVQAVDDDGNGVSLTSDVFKAIKSEDLGSLVRFDFNAESSAKLRFSFGRDSECTWTPIEMPFLTVTLLDFDCGVDRPQCEAVTSTRTWC